MAAGDELIKEVHMKLLSWCHSCNEAWRQLEIQFWVCIISSQVGLTSEQRKKEKRQLQSQSQALKIG
jgi:hypothetical protein